MVPAEDSLLYDVKKCPRCFRYNPVKTVGGALKEGGKLVELQKCKFCGIGLVNSK